MKNFINQNKHIHFVGIGGIGMSGMAELLYNHGFIISGSDLNRSDRTKHLSSIGINIFIGHHTNNILGSDLIVYSSAIKKENKEIIAGEDKNIPIIKRSELLGEIIKIKDISIAVAGTHGKTTTSSMLGSIIHEANLDPTLIIGGIVNKFNSNNISGNGDIIVVEADEFDRSFLALNPTYSIINNLDLEHLDCYKDINDLKNTFCTFANSIPFYGKVAINNDSKFLNEINKQINKSKVTYGIDNKSDIMAEIISYNKNQSIFNITSNYYNNNFEIELNYPGKHNIYNALAATTIALEIGISESIIIQALKKYSGVKRRFELAYYNKNNNIILIDDYAHHPIEVKYTLDAAKSGWTNRIISIFEPHLYSRTKDFYKQFANALSISDKIIITDIYGAREKPIGGVTSELIVQQLKNNNFNDVLYIKDKNNIPKKLIDLIYKNDMIIYMGAGKINSIINKSIELIQNKYE